MTWPDTFSGSRYRHPQHLSVTFTSTLSPTLVNEARVGMRRTGFTEWNGLTIPNPSEAVQAVLSQLQRISRFSWDWDLAR